MKKQEVSVRVGEFRGIEETQWKELYEVEEGTGGGREEGGGREVGVPF